MNTKRTAPTTGKAIAAYMDERGIRRQFVVNRVNVRKDVLSRMLSDTGRAPSEQLTATLVRDIARALDVSRSIEDEWLALLESARTPVAV